MAESTLLTYSMQPIPTVMPRERDENSGKYTDAYGDEEFIAAIEQIEGVAGTREIADSVGCSKRQALNRLRELENEGVMMSKDVGRSLVWQLVEKDEL